MRIGLIIGLAAGLQIGPGEPASGAAPPASGPKFPMTAAAASALWTELGSSLGAPSYLWPFDEASGNAVDAVVGEVLAPTGTPNYQVVPTAFPTELGISLDVDSNDRLSGSTSLMNPGTGEFMFRQVCEFGAAPATVVTVFEKFVSGIGYALQMNTDGSLDWKIATAAATQIINIPTSHAGETHLVDCGRTGSTIYLRTGHGFVTVALTATGDANNASVYRDGRFLSAGVLLIHKYAFLASACSAADDDDWQQYANHLEFVVGAA